MIKRYWSLFDRTFAVQFRIIYCLLLCLLCATIGAQTTKDIVREAEATAFATKKLVYKTIGTVSLDLQLIYPATSNKNCPAIIFFFGGGWVNGQPAQFEHQAKYFAKRGMIAVLADYRTQSKNNTGPFEAVRDAKSAIRYLRQHAEELHIDTGMIVAAGGSAGGHLAAAADLTRLDEDGEDPAISSRPNALVLFNPVFDNGPGGYGYEKTGDRYNEISPLHNIRKGAAPAIVFFGTKDVHVPVATAELYKSKMLQAGSRCDLFLYKDQKHGFFNYKRGTDNEYFLVTLREADVFLTSLSYIKPLKDVARKNYADYVNPFIGTAPLTDSAVLGYRLPRGWRSWAGLVYPGSSLPNAMVQLSPMTEYGSGAGYEYEDSLILGFTHTNKGHWNLCNIPVLPLPEHVENNGQFFSRFSHKKEIASPAFYHVYLSDFGISVSLTSTLRCGYHRYEFKENKNRKILFDLAKANNKVSDWYIERAGSQSVRGYQKARAETIYFYATLNTKIARINKPNEGQADGFAILELENDNNPVVELKIGLSFVSMQNARKNLEQEIGERTFEDVHAAGRQTWENILSTIRVQGGTEKQKEMFYSCFYRSLLWPALRSDVNGQYTDVEKKVARAKFNYYTVPSLWDTYRNKDVLLGIVSPGITLDIIKSLKDMGDRTGFIPTFFHGDHAASSITGAFLRGITDFDVKGVYKLLLRNATLEGGSRPYITEYIQKGYISDPDIADLRVETKGKAGVSKTLEYAYDDYSLAQLARALGDTIQYRQLVARSKNYKNVFDPATKFMRGRLENGEWIKNFNPQFPYYEYMYREANAWQVSFYVPHDMNGLIELYGGENAFEAKLDSFFTLPWNPKYIARNVETMVGQYCQGNQPDHEAPFSYYFINKPEKSQKIIDYVLNNLYGIGKEGLALSGMDDAGEMSAWYVFNALGLYPFSATDPAYIVTVPLFDEINWRQADGRVLTIKKTGAGRALNAIKVDGKTIDGYFISHDLFKKGGEIIIHTKQ